MAGHQHDLGWTSRTSWRPTIRLMRVRISNPSKLDELIEFLRAAPNAIIERLSDHEVEVSLLGSYAADAMRMQLYLQLRAWEASRRAAGTRVEILN